MRRSRYSDLRLIGRGGFAEVFWATDRATNAPVALKLLQSALASDADAVGRFEREIRITRDLDDVDGVVSILDDGLLAGRRFYATAFYPYGSLDRLTVPMQPGAIAAVLSEVGRTLGEVHGRGILHRDIKPSNLLVTADGDVHVADFGIGWIEDDRTTTTGFLGSRQFAAPEVLTLGAVAADERSDVYSLGVVGRELIDRASAVGAEVISLELEQVVDRATRRDPSDRIQSMRSLVIALDQAFELSGDSSTVAIPAPVALPESGATPDPTRPPQPSRVRRFSIPAAATAVVVAATAIVVNADDPNRAVASGQNGTASDAAGVQTPSEETSAPALELDTSATSADALELIDFASENELQDVVLNISLTDFNDQVRPMDNGILYAYVPGTCDQFCDGNAYEVLLEETVGVTDSSMYYDSGALILKGRFAIRNVSIQTGGIYSISLRTLDLG